jgi:glycosyltransferase involved in cell wall biosynthesis
MGYAETGYQGLRWQDKSPPPNPDIDAVIFSRPHHDSLLSAYKRMGIPTIVDMDDDFHTIPENHPGYQVVGPGDPIWLMKLENCIYLADHVTVTTNELSNRLARFRDDPNSITVIPNGWSSSEPYWLSKRSVHKDKIVIGWGGTITHREDFQMCIKPIKRILKEHPNVMICIAGDYEIYRYFAPAPEKQRGMIPMVRYELYPLVLSTWDILIAPLLNTEFNRAKSDIKLVDACARGIPFVASDMPVYSNWDKGGILASDDEWYDVLKRLVEDSELRKRLGQEGKKNAKEREMIELGDLWADTIEKTIVDNMEVYE